MFPAPSCRDRAPGPRQRLLRAEQQPARHLVRTNSSAHFNRLGTLSAGMRRRQMQYRRFGSDMAGAGKLRSDWNVCLLTEVTSQPIGPGHLRLMSTCSTEFLDASPLSLLAFHLTFIWTVRVNQQNLGKMRRRAGHCTTLCKGVGASRTSSRCGACLRCAVAGRPRPGALEPRRREIVSGGALICCSRPKTP